MLVGDALVGNGMKYEGLGMKYEWDVVWDREGKEVYRACGVRIREATFGIGVQGRGQGLRCFC